MKNLLIIQARMDSKRLPGKVLKKIGDKSIIEIIFKRLSQSKKIDKIVIATTKSKTDDKLCKLLQAKSIDFYRGDSKNVLKRFYNLSKKYNPKNIIRITADNPLIDYTILNKMLNIFDKKNVDYFSNTQPPTFPDGLDVEIFTFKALKVAHKLAKSKYDKEHVTPFMYKNLTKDNYVNSKDMSELRWTVDEKIDYLLMKKIFGKFNNIYFNWQNVLKLKNKDKNIFNLNLSIKRNEGADETDTQKMWKRALKVIPNGNMFLSKNPNQFLPGIWPSHFLKSKKSYVWDFDNKKYLDFCTMGVGTNVLGYSNKIIDDAVKKNISKGNMSSLNCPEEVILSEKLLDIHKEFQKVRLARTGGEANAIAIRIARANTKKHKVLICGYHGWHDWYLAANLSNSKNLDKHLLPGLSPLGVPKFLKNTTKTFQYNDFKEFKKQIDQDSEIGIVKMEVVRTIQPKDNFLQKIRDYTRKKNIILIFDECTTGFRETYGGLYKKYKVVPDMVIFGKAIGNGYPITAVLGKDTIMKSSVNTFLSSTFWSDRIGPTAAIATLNLMKKTNSWKIVNKIGKQVKYRWKTLFEKYSIKANVWGLNAIIGFNFESKNNLKYKTFISQELLKKKILASNVLYVSITHEQKEIDRYFYEFEKVLSKIQLFEQNELIKIDKFINNKTANQSFKRLN